MWTHALVLLVVAGCAFRPSGLATSDDGGADSATHDDAPGSDGAGTDDAPAIDAPAIDAPAIDALAIDAPAIDAPGPDPYCMDTGLDVCFRMNQASGAPIDGHTPPLALARADGVSYLASCPNHGNALDLGASVFVRTDEPPGSTGRMTAAAWLKLDGDPPAGRHMVLDADNDWGLSYVGASSGAVSVTCLVVLSGGGTEAVTATLSNITAWNHVACSFNADRLRLFLNGVRAETNAANDNLADSASGFQIGRDGIDGADVVDGLIDDVRIWNRAVSDGDIMAMATAGCQ